MISIAIGGVAQPRHQDIATAQQDQTDGTLSYQGEHGLLLMRVGGNRANYSGLTNAIDNGSGHNCAAMPANVKRYS